MLPRTGTGGQAIGVAEKELKTATKARPKRKTGSQPANPPRDTLLARRLTHLYATTKPENGKKKYSDADVADALCAAAGDEDFVGRTHLYQLRTGRSDNPTYKLILELARFFGVSPTYFFPDEDAARGELPPEIKSVLRDDGLRDITLEAAGLSPSAREAVRQMIASVRGLDTGKG